MVHSGVVYSTVTPEAVELEQSGPGLKREAAVLLYWKPICHHYEHSFKMGQMPTPPFIGT